MIKLYIPISKEEYDMLSIIARDKRCSVDELIAELITDWAEGVTERDNND